MRGCELAVVFPFSLDPECHSASELVNRCVAYWHDDGMIVMRSPFLASDWIYGMENHGPG